MSSKPTIVIRDRVYLPVSSIVDTDDLKNKYTRHLFKDVSCAQCEYKPERPCSVCETCASYQGVTKLWIAKNIKGAHYIGVPVGDKRNIERKSGVLFDEHRIQDVRHLAPFQYKIKFLIKLRPHQTKIVDDFMKKQYGLLEAPPRTGKTVLMLYISLLLGQRVVLLANQHEFLQQFIWHIEGNEEEGIPKCTNLPELELKYGKKLYGFPRTAEDFENMQLMVMTYQQFASATKGNERFKQLSKQIGTVVVDEVHKVGASTFSAVLNKFHTRYRFGVTGTVTRKDGRHKITELIMGPVVARTTVEALVPKVFIKETGIKLRSVPKLWVYMMKALSNNKLRNKMIVDRCIKDVKAGHSVVIPLTFVKNIHALVEQINEAYGEIIAKAFVGGGNSAKHKEVRRKILSEAKSGEIKVIVGTRSLLQLGLNVPRWSAIYTIIPISNAPNYKQETSRIRTPMDGKRRPIIRLFYDAAMGASVGCARACVTQMKEWKYEFSKDEKTQEAVEYFKTAPRRGQPADDDEQYKPQSLLDYTESDAGTTSFGRAGRR